MNINKRTLTLCEGAICVALAIALSYLKIKIGAQGGSLNFAMIPLIIFAVHSGGLGFGVLAGAIFGLLKFFFAEGFALNWESMLLDYAVAYAAVGLAGIMKGKLNTWPRYLTAALIACLARFVIHFISGVTVYADYAESIYLGVATPNAWVYSAVYNGFYMAFNTIAAVIICPLLGAALSRLPGAAKSKA
ncbi:MAG: energy-coupled thiamine transporter ThiT [Oscillospiraceae bacterium]|jgi:thiamine transporter|nr:energy-coupled thiamine transporter ThiT [Oscillospiraceae bacterium]